ncbi:MAG: hypothetical protein L3J31_06130, partial [Bacteroidales bacterium]|nr:hypothetical protein [Bacteroidales bacterium]
MKKITFLLALMAFFAVNVFGQEVVSSSPAWDGSNQIDLCEGGSFTISITNTDATHTYNLTQADSRALLQTLPGNGGTITFNPVTPVLGSTSYSAFDATDYSPFVNFTTNVVVQPTAPTMTKSPNQSAVCAGTDVSASIATAGSGGVTSCTDSYEYSTDGGTSWSAYTPGTAISTTGLSGTDIVQILATRSDPDGRGCDASNLYKWTVNAAVNPALTGETAPCFNSNETYTTDAGMSAYNWTVTNGTISSGSGTYQITVDWTSATGAGTVSVYFDDGNTCTSNTTTLNVDVKALPVPTISGPTTICANATETYTTETGMTAYSWTIVGGTGTSTTESIDITWDNSPGTTHSVTATYTDGNSCAGTGSAYAVTVEGLVQNTTTGIYYCTIQEAIDDASTTSVENIAVSNGTYIENLVVDRGITITGESETGVVLMPTLSAPMPGSSGSLPAGASNLMLIQVDDVTIQYMTIDGDNPSLTSETVVNGADIDALNGIIQDFTAGSFTNLNVNHITMQNIYLRGIYASTGGDFDISNNTVSNVAGEAQSIPIMNWSGTGVFSYNSVSNSNDGIVSNHSKGVTYEYNTVTNCGSGIHTDNNGDAAGSTADTIRYNTVSNGTAGSYGIWVFASRLNNEVYENTVSGVSVGLCASGQVGGTPLFSRNTVNNAETGVYTTTSLFGWGSSDCSATFTNNYINNSTTEAFNCEAEASYTNATTENNNHITGSTTNANASGAGTLSIDLTCNWWGSIDAGVIAAGMNGNVQFLPFLTDGTDDDGSTPGFQPVPNSCDGVGPVLVYDNDPSTTGTLVSSHMKIQEGIDASTTLDGY